MKKVMILSFGVVIGALLGFVYWYYVGCLSGSCAITSSPVNSTIYGGVLGILTTSHFTSGKKQPDKEGK